MPVVVPVKFAYASRDLWFDPQGLDIVEADHAICSTERGCEIGLVTADPFEVPEDELSAPLKPVLRIATDDDLDYADELAQRGDDAMEDFRRLVKQNELDMKPVGVEYLFGGEKVVFYFAAEDRVDFRQLVKDLSSRFHMRIDMRQIGVRDETRLVGGFAHCGQELCCTRFGGQFEPVSIRMAKEQDLPLNSAKISGVCGRLMCCLRYEFEAYKDFKSRAPKKKTLIDTPLGKAKIQEYNTPREQLVLRLESGKVFRVNLSDMTCSEGCKKRAEEQGCNCRPDCVTRDILERIESPDIALALMELDREAGIDVGDGLSHADRLVPEAPARHRRQRSGEHGGEERSQRGQRGRGGDDRGQGAADEQTPRRRRRRSGAGAGADGVHDNRGPAHEVTEGQAPSRRRRRHLSSEERDDAFRAAAAREAAASASEKDGAPGRSRRRRHTAASQSGQPSGERAQSKPQIPSVADQVASGEVKVTRRRPGDGGGARAAEQAAGASTADEQAPRRRRRRSRKPRGGADGAAGGADNTPSAE